MRIRVQCIHNFRPNACELTKLRYNTSKSIYPNTKYITRFGLYKCVRKMLFKNAI